MKVPPTPPNKTVVRNSRTRLGAVKSKAQSNLSVVSNAPITASSSQTPLPPSPHSLRTQPSSIKQYFTPHMIHLWLKNLESIVHLNEAWNKKLNEDFTSWYWILHREKIKNSHQSLPITKEEYSLIASYIKTFPCSTSVIQAISAIIFRPPQVVKEIYDRITLGKKEPEEDTQWLGTIYKPFISKTLARHYEELLNIEKNLIQFDYSLALLWDKNVSPPQAYQPYRVYNNIDDEVIPYLKYTLENLINWKVKSPDVEFNYGCDCEDNCQDKKCSCAADNEDGYPMKNGRLIRSDIGPIYECNSNCKCNETCPFRVIQNSVRNNSNFEIFKTPNKGWGVRTLVTIKEGSFVMEHVGEILESRTAKLREVCYDKLDMLTYFDFDFGFDESKRSNVLCADSNYWCNISRFLNHSCNPNLITIPFFVEYKDIRFQRVAFFAQRNIPASTELTFDYKIKSDDFECLCGSSLCRYNKGPSKTNYKKSKRSKMEID
ncbi:1019_t:CDS:10 [Acaulospora morrowiae]|uniref:1019_t:CDS:1 n=1 Tax=Acaulospora morrowiae TaxID=94023 RepID=A0A9N9C4D0_9GLOM|nr:1019_t:CDS:10 [Acaulospora morrowiae]